METTPIPKSRPNAAIKADASRTLAMSRSCKARRIASEIRTGFGSRNDIAAGIDSNNATRQIFTIARCEFATHDHPPSCETEAMAVKILSAVLKSADLKKTQPIRTARKVIMLPMNEPSEMATKRFQA